MSNTFSEVKKIVGGFIVLVVICYTSWYALGFYLMYKDDVQNQARMKWEWQHYTGYRLVSAGGLHTYPTEQGILVDKKLGGKECTTKGYPDYPTCPPQEYVTNGQPQSLLVPPPGFGPVVLDLSKSTPIPQTDPTSSGIDFSDLGGKEIQPLSPPQKEKLKTGVVFLLDSCYAPPDCLACCPPNPIGVTLYSDARRHLSSSDTIPFGTKVTILGRKNAVPILDKDGFRSGYSDLVHVSVLGKIGWLEANLIKEDPEVEQ